MAHTYSSIYFHYIFATKNLQKIIKDDLRKRLWAFMGGIARKNDMDALSIGGVEDHVHLLLSLPTRISISKAIQLIKGGSSHWIHTAFPQYQDFRWQEGYGVFSVSRSRIDNLQKYIKTQREHHRMRSFREEYVAFLIKHGIKYDNRYICG
jgi:REP element-mobilizing transposase RayT